LKKFTAILSLLCILVFSCGSFFIYKIYLRSYKKEFRSFVNIQKQDKLESYTIPLNQLYVSSAVLKWEDENKEVIIEGKLYDVIALVIQNDQVILSLLPDFKELQLKQEFADLFNDSAKNSSPFLNLLKQMLNLKFESNSFSFLSYNTLNEVCFTDFLFNLPEVSLKSPFIPPSFS